MKLLYVRVIDIHFNFGGRTDSFIVQQQAVGRQDVIASLQDDLTRRAVAFAQVPLVVGELCLKTTAIWRIKRYC